MPTETTIFMPSPIPMISEPGNCDESPIPVASIISTLTQKVAPTQVGVAACLRNGGITINIEADKDCDCKVTQARSLYLGQALLDALKRLEQDPSVWGENKALVLQFRFCRDLNDPQLRKAQSHNHHQDSKAE